MIGECRQCGQNSELAKGRPVCKVCWNHSQREWRHKNPSKWAELKAKYHAQNRQNPKWVESEQRRGREYWQKLRHEAIMAYGGYRCNCCGETEKAFLSLDHIFGGGAEHRREMKNGNPIAKWLKDHCYPAGFQVLCMNCNFGRFMNKGICPHKVASQENCVNSGKIQNG